MAEIFKNIQMNQTVYILDKAAMELKEGTVKDNQPHIGSTYTIKEHTESGAEYLEIIKRPVHDEDGNVIGIIGLKLTA